MGEERSGLMRYIAAGAAIGLVLAAIRAGLGAGAGSAWAEGARFALGAVVGGAMGALFAMIRNHLAR